jgi:ribosomal protein S18 acetylase RimI-like enzyme
MTDLSIRPFQYPQDYPAVYDLWAHAGTGVQLRKSDEPAEIEKKLARDPDLFLVAEADGKIIGTALGGFDGRRGMVYHLAVDAAYRQRGIGTQLMNELEARLKAKGCIRYYLLVTKENDAAMKLYEELGWQKMDLAVYGKNIA